MLTTAYTPFFSTTHYTLAPKAAPIVTFGEEPSGLSKPLLRVPKGRVKYNEFYFTKIGPVMNFFHNEVVNGRNYTIFSRPQPVVEDRNTGYTKVTKSAQFNVADMYCELVCKMPNDHKTSKRDYKLGIWSSQELIGQNNSQLFSLTLTTQGLEKTSGDTLIVGDHAGKTVCHNTRSDGEEMYSNTVLFFHALAKKVLGEAYDSTAPSLQELGSSVYQSVSSSEAAG